MDRKFVINVLCPRGSTGVSIAQSENDIPSLDSQISTSQPRLCRLNAVRAPTGPAPTTNAFLCLDEPIAVVWLQVIWSMMIRVQDQKDYGDHLKCVMEIADDSPRHRYIIAL